MPLGQSTSQWRAITLSGSTTSSEQAITLTKKYQLRGSFLDATLLAEKDYMTTVVKLKLNSDYIAVKLDKLVHLNLVKQTLN